MALIENAKGREEGGGSGYERLYQIVYNLNRYTTERVNYQGAHG